MGFYLRKSFRMGPVRFNLSKSGVGMSAGVTGARVGISSQGRPYVHGGRYGLYYRQYLDSPSRGGSGGTAGTVRGAAPVLLHETTGVTFDSGHIDHTQSPPLLVAPKHSAVLRGTLAVAGAIALMFALGKPASDVVVPAVIGIACVFAAAVLMWRAKRAGRAAAALSSLLESTFKARAPVTPEQKTAIQQALAAPLRPEDRDYACRRAYMDVLVDIVSDQKATAADVAVLKEAESMLALPPDFCQHARTDVFHGVYLEAVADDALTDEEETRLAHIRTELDIPADNVANELHVIARLHEIRDIRDGNLPTVDASVKLHDGEVCHHETRVRVLKENTLKSFQRQGQRYKVRGLVLDREGTLLVTDRRLLIVTSGTTSIDYHKLLDLEVDEDHDLLTLTRDGAVHPVLLSTPDTLKTGAIIAAAAKL